MPNYRNLHLLRVFEPSRHRNMQMVMYISLELGIVLRQLGLHLKECITCLHSLLQARSTREVERLSLQLRAINNAVAAERSLAIQDAAVACA